MNFDPIHWLCAGLIVVLVAMSIYTKVISTELKAAEASLAAVGLIGEAQEKDTKKEDKESKENKEVVDEEYRKSLDVLRRDNERLRHKITSSRSLPAAPQTCTGGGETTTIDWPLVEREVDSFRIEVRGLVEEGDANREGLDSVKEWVDKELD